MFITEQRFAMLYAGVSRRTFRQYNLDSGRKQCFHPLHHSNGGTGEGVAVIGNHFNLYTTSRCGLQGLAYHQQVVGVDGHDNIPGRFGDQVHSHLLCLLCAHHAQHYSTSIKDQVSGVISTFLIARKQDSGTILKKVSFLIISLDNLEALDGRGSKLQDRACGRLKARHAWSPAPERSSVRFGYLFGPLLPGGFASSDQPRRVSFLSEGLAQNGLGGDVVSFSNERSF
jgi:hypothetical protein